MATLCQLADASTADVTSVIEGFRDPTRSFLMPPANEPLEPETIIDISHESLMRIWNRLDKWADKETESVKLYRRLAETAALHDAGKANLWQDPELQITLDWRDTDQPNEVWASRYHPGFSTAMNFLLASKAERVKILRKKQRRTALIAIAIPVALLVGMGAIVFFQQQQIKVKAEAVKKLETYSELREEYFEAVKLIRKGEYQSATKILNQVRKEQDELYQEDCNPTISVHYSDTLTQIGNVKALVQTDLSELPPEYSTAFEIRDKLVSTAVENDEPGIQEYRLKLANSYMNIANFEEQLGKQSQDYSAARSYFIGAEEKHNLANQLRKKSLDSGILDQVHQTKGHRELGSGYHNLQVLFNTWYKKGRDFFATKDANADNSELAAWRNEYLGKKNDRPDIINKAIDQFEVVLQMRGDDADTKFALTSNKISLAIADPTLFPQAFEDLEKIVEDNPKRPEFRQELARAHYQWGIKRSNPNPRQSYEKTVEIIVEIQNKHPEYTLANELLSKAKNKLAELKQGD